jgi:hypothetical protein
MQFTDRAGYRNRATDGDTHTRRWRYWLQASVFENETQAVTGLDNVEQLRATGRTQATKHLRLALTLGALRRFRSNLPFQEHSPTIAASTRTHEYASRRHKQTRREFVARNVHQVIGGVK